MPSRPESLATKAIMSFAELPALVSSCLAMHSLSTVSFPTEHSSMLQFKSESRYQNDEVVDDIHSGIQSFKSRVYRHLVSSL